MCVYSSALRRALVCHHSFRLSSFRLPLFSQLPPVTFFHQLSQLYHPLRLCEALLCFPDCFISLAHSSIYSLFSAVSSAALLCFSSSDPTFQHLREIRRKLASENLQLKAPVPHLLSRSQLGNWKTFTASPSLSENRDVSQRVSGLAV